MPRSSSPVSFAATTTLLLLAACAPGASPPGRTPPGPAVVAGVRPGTSTVLDALQQSQRAGARVAAVWPDFDLSAQVLLAVFEPNGPVYLLGDHAPPPDYRWFDRDRGIAVRRGPPPDSLRGLNLGMSWNGRVMNATAVTFLSGDRPEYIPHFLVHEAFHTYQKQLHTQDPRRFESRQAPSLPATLVPALTLLNLEGAYLARALREPDAPAARNLADTALALRTYRCRKVGPGECRNERAMERSEGTASYVTAAAFDEALGYGGPGVWRDSLARALSPIQDVERLERWHFYDSGHAWLLLLRRFGRQGWEKRVEVLSPDEVLAEELRFDTASVDSLVGVIQRSVLGSHARASAEAATGRELTRRDSAERAFFQRPATPVRVYFGRPRSVVETTGTLPDGTLQNIFEFGEDRVVIRGPARQLCCPGQMTIVPLAGRTASVDGRPVSLDRPGTSATGRLVLNLPELEVRFQKGELRVFQDSVTIQTLTSKPPAAADSPPK